MENTYEYWQHRATGVVWAIKLQNGRAVGAVQIDRKEVDIHLLPHLPYVSTEAWPIDQQRADFRRIDGRMVA